MSITSAQVPAERIIDYDAFDLISITEMRDKAEVWRSKGRMLWTTKNGGHWVTLSSELTREILKDPDRFSSAKPNQGVSLTYAERQLHVPLEMDPPEHRKYRRLLTPLFAVERMKLLEGTIRSKAREQLSGFASAGQVELVENYSRPVVSSMFLQLMDWPLEDRVQLETMVEQWLNGGRGLPAEERGRLKAEAGVMADAYCREQIYRRRHSKPVAGGEDMTRALMGSTIDDEPIDDEMLVRLLKLLMIAGLDTAYSALSQSFGVLARQPDARRYVRENVAEMPRIVEEMLRWNAPAQVTRTAMERIDLDGMTVQPGESVHCLINAVNRDPDEFPSPLEINFNRSTNRHMAFSAGTHRCVGAPLARTVIAIALEEFHVAIPDYEIVSERSHLGGVWGLDELNLRWNVA